MQYPQSTTAPKPHVIASRKDKLKTLILRRRAISILYLDELSFHTGAPYPHTIARVKGRRPFNLLTAYENVGVTLVVNDHAILLPLDAAHCPLDEEGLR